jgi:GT2 family glycosyltransferase
VSPDERPNPALAVVIVAYETPELLAACLRSLAAAQVLGRHPVIVVDNSQTSRCAAVCAGFPGVTLERNARNVGYARAVNQGMAHESAQAAELVLVLNPDIEVERDAIDRLRQAMADHPEAGLAGAKLLNPDRTLQYSCRRFYTLGALLLRRTFLGRLFPRHRALREHLMLDWDHATLRDVDWLIGACLLVRRAAAQDVGPMDERFFLYFEDVDWCARMHARGWRVLYVPDAVMVHHHRRESARASLFHPSRRSHLASVLRFYEKWSLLLYLLKRNRDRLRGIVLVTADLLAMNAAFLAAFGARKLLATHLAKPLFPVADYWQFLLVFNLATLFALRRFGLYRPGGPTDPMEVGLRVAQSVLLSALAVLVSTFLLYIRAYSRFVILLTVPLAITGLWAGRMLWAHFVDRLAASGLAARRVLIAGDRELGSWMAERLRAAPSPSRYEVVGLLDPATRILAHDGEAARRLRELCHAERVQEVVIADRDGRFVSLARDLAPLAGEGVRVHLVGPWAQALDAGMRLESMAGVDLLRPGRGASKQTGGTRATRRESP